MNDAAHILVKLFEIHRERTKNAIRCDNAVDSINSLLSAFPLLVESISSLQMEFMLVEPESCCCVDIDVVDDGDFFVVVALSLGMYDKQEPTNVFVDKPKLYERGQMDAVKRDESTKLCRGIG